MNAEVSERRKVSGNISVFELVKRHLDEGALERHKKVAGFRKRPRFSGIPSVFEGVLRTTKEVWRNAV